MNTSPSSEWNTLEAGEKMSNKYKSAILKVALLVIEKAKKTAKIGQKQKKLKNIRKKWKKVLTIEKKYSII